MEFFIKAVQLILSLSILVILHEFGHFAFARLFKTRVEKFYLFFNPWFTLFKFKKGDTEYGLGWLPLGGYVKISGMIDESMDKEAMALPPQPYEFRSKPAWQRLLIMTGGVLVNFITALFIFWMILYYYGESYAPVKSAKFGLHYHEIAGEIGLQDGDIVTKVGDFEIETSGEIAKHILLEDVSHLTVLRNGQTLELPVPDDFGQKLMAKEVKDFAEIQFPTIVHKVVKGSNAEKAGLLAGDSIVGVDTLTTTYFHQFSQALAAKQSDTANIHVIRAGAPVTLRAEVTSKGTIGFQPTGFGKYVDVKVHQYSLLESLPKGIDMGLGILTTYIKQMKLLFTKEGVKQLGGFGAMGSLYEGQWIWYKFWFNTALISLILAFMNILPIPALDGGHVLFLLYEMVSGRKPGDKFMEYAQITGMLLLLGLLILANGNDIIKNFF